MRKLLTSKSIKDVRRGAVLSRLEVQTPLHSHIRNSKMYSTTQIPVDAHCGQNNCHCSGSCSCQANDCKCGK
ncbi:hypothetical protein K523DRAFT_291055 [Schizophyllum commune Tattone D]|nr:hypothetical protein K523DRAFT_291055 [Schizophyllum commune Tattone D]